MGFFLDQCNHKPSSLFDQLDSRRCWRVKSLKVHSCYLSDHRPKSLPLLYSCSISHCPLMRYDWSFAKSFTKGCHRDKVTGLSQSLNVSRQIQMVHFDPETMTSFSRQYIVPKTITKNDDVTVKRNRSSRLKYWWFWFFLVNKYEMLMMISRPLKSLSFSHFIWQ